MAGMGFSVNMSPSWTPTQGSSGGRNEGVEKSQPADSRTPDLWDQVWAGSDMQERDLLSEAIFRFLQRAVGDVSGHRILEAGSGSGPWPRLARGLRRTSGRFTFLSRLHSGIWWGQVCSAF